MNYQQPPPVFQPPPSKGVPIWAIVLIVLLSLPLLMCGGCLVFFGAVSHNVSVAREEMEAAMTPEQRKREAEEKRVDSAKWKLKEIAAGVVTKSLKYPESAEWGWTKGDAWIYGEYARVAGDVKAKNAFGMASEIPYEIDMKIDSDLNFVKFIKVTIDGEMELVDVDELDPMDRAIDETK